MTPVLAAAQDTATAVAAYNWRDFRDSARYYRRKWRLK